MWEIRAEMASFLLAIVFLFGLLFGSFLNVCIYRIPRDLSVVAPRSFCPACERQLSWQQNIPVVSFFLLRGRCRYCSQAISWRYPLVEVISAVLCTLVVAFYGFTPAAAKWACFELVLIVLFFTDWEERILPDEVILFASLAAILSFFFVPLPGVLADLLLPHGGWRGQSFVNALVGAGLLALPIWLLGTVWSWLRKREALGFGDVKLLAMLGLFLGPEHGLLAITIGTVGGAVFGVAGLLLNKKEAASYGLPFGSFLCLGAAIIPFLFRLSPGLLAVP